MKYIITLACILLPAVSEAQQALLTRHVFLITFDGLQRQEVFTGADSTLVDDEVYVDAPQGLYERFWAPDPFVHRERLMPFLWNVIAKEGQSYGNRRYGNNADVTNTFRFSYPGYNEILTRFADDRIDSNDKTPNPMISPTKSDLRSSDRIPGRRGISKPQGSITRIRSRRPSPLSSGWTTRTAERSDR